MLKEEIATAAAHRADLANGVLEMELARLDEVQIEANKRIEQGIESAVRDLLKIMERRSKLLGLDAPEKHRIVTDDTSFRLIVDLNTPPVLLPAPPDAPFDPLED